MYVCMHFLPYKCSGGMHHVQWGYAPCAVGVCTMCSGGMHQQLCTRHNFVHSPQPLLTLFALYMNLNSINGAPFIPMCVCTLFGCMHKQLCVHYNLIRSPQPYPPVPPSVVLLLLPSIVLQHNRNSKFPVIQ